MKKLHDLSIKRKFGIVLIPLIVMIICFDFLHIRHDYFDYQDARRLNKAISIGVEINQLVHEIQKERSISVGFQANQGESFYEKLLSQRQVTDSLLNHLYTELRGNHNKELMRNHLQDIQDMKIQFSRLNEVRENVDQHNLETSQIITYFSEINKAALYTVNQLINETRDKAAAQQVHAIIYFLEGKEQASTERALGTYMFSTNKDDKSLTAELAAIIASQEAYVEAFMTISDDESVDFFVKTMQGTVVDEVSSFRSKLFSSNDDTVDPSKWYTVVTQKINALKRVEDFMLDRMSNYTANLATESRNSFFIFLLLDFLIGFITFSLVAMIVFKLIKNVGILEAFTMKFIGGNTNERVQIDTKDEIGQYAKTFNLMLDTITRTQGDLKKEKQKALYMYENIYKKAEVVFENVEQGIFLLDKNLKISNLYSRAVERIFGNKIVANENFCTFMKPRIVQRDFEALEIFMDHLFNAEIDEDILNKLNPLEDVKIFISTNGVVVNKFLKISFTRIFRGETIQSILVTITDNTESVLIQKQMEESEHKKRKDTEYLLNILNVEPRVLQDFISETRRSLKEISEKYEQNPEGNLNGLLEYTFRTLHKIKGNSLSLGIEMISEQIHETEDSIVGLMNQSVTAEMFLTVLYELEEVDHMLIEMKRMHLKVEEIYSKLQTEHRSSAADKLHETIRSGFASLRKLTRKRVDMDLSIHENVHLSDEYTKAVKDMLIQLIRNSLSHGIEEPEDRLALGKRERGQIRVSISKPDYDCLEISYEDDGRGLNLEAIKDRAMDLGLIIPENGETLREDQIVDLIFNGDFSTSAEADKLSGRGKGMGLVKDIADNLNGVLEVDHLKDHYFRIKINLKVLNVSKMEKVA